MKGMIIKEIITADEKSCICNSILRALPSWFGIEDSIAGYVRDVEDMTFFAAHNDTDVVGIVALKLQGAYTAEVFVMGVLEEYHNQGIGKSLINVCVEYCIENKIEFLTVKTLDESIENERYMKTRLFYQAMGFRKLETFPLLWDENNPCLFMAKQITT